MSRLQPSAHRKALDRAFWDAKAARRTMCRHSLDLRAKARVTLMIPQEVKQ